MYSFVKELDERTLCLVRYLDESEPALKRKYRNLRIFVVWIGGDEDELTEWAKDNGVENLPMGVIDVDDETLGQWRINKRVRSTTVVLDRTQPLASFVDLEPQQPQDAAEFEKTVADGLQRWRR